MTLAVGFVGLGTMGVGMARNLAKAGFPLTVATRTPGKAEAFARELGGNVRAAASAEEVARASQVVVSCLPDAPEVEEVHLGERGHDPRSDPRDDRRGLLDDRRRGGARGSRSVWPTPASRSSTRRFPAARRARPRGR